MKTSDVNMVRNRQIGINHSLNNWEFRKISFCQTLYRHTGYGHKNSQSESMFLMENYLDFIIA
jgi:hypothetical protein